MKKRDRTVFALNGDSTKLAVSAGNPKKDECGQKPYLFISGEWKDQVILVEPYKMVRQYRARV